MNHRLACDCPRCRARGLMGPVLIITVGALFLLAEFLPRYHFRDLWPVILIVVGIVKLLEYSAPLTGHRG